MIEVKSFTFNPFQENTYILFDETRECIIIDPGCSNESERVQLSTFIDTKKLTPVHLINTHCHIDHILGNQFISDTYRLKLESNPKEQAILDAAGMQAQFFGIENISSPPIEIFLDEGDQVSFGNSILDIVFTPGHCPGEISFYNKEQNILIAGDVLFYQSIGRTDLPGGDYNTLIESIKNKFYPLGDDMIVYPGHGPQTNIGFERSNNPFL